MPWGIYPGRKIPALIWGLLVQSARRGLRKNSMVLMPHEIHALVVTLTSEAEDASTAGQNWSLVSKWGLMAAQKETTNGNSLVALAVNAVMEGDDEYLGRWLEQRLDTTMGPRPMTWTSGMINRGTTGPQDVSQVSALMATEVGKGVALGLQSLAPLYYTKRGE